MDNAQRTEIATGLMALTRAPGRDSKADQPLNHLRDICPALLDLVFESMASIGVRAIDPEAATRGLLETVALDAQDDKVTVKQAGDLLGLTPDDDVWKAWQEYKNKEGRKDAPENYVRFNREIRKVMAASRNGLSISRNRYGEAKWMHDFAAELFTYLDNEDGKLTDFARMHGYLPPAEVDTKPNEIDDSHAAGVTEQTSDYIRRDAYHDQFSQILASGIRLIVLAGLPGVGKSYLADALTRECSTADVEVPIIKMTQGELAPDTVHEALTLARIEADQIDVWEHPERYLVELLCTDKAPQFVIFECNDINEIAPRLPARTRSTIVVTCRRMRQIPQRHAVIEVGYMERPETVALIQGSVPGINDREAELLADALYDYPLLVRCSCGLLRRQRWDIARFCQEIKSDAALLADEADTDEGKSLLAVLTRLAELVKTEDALAYEALTCLTFVNSSPTVEWPFLITYIREATGGKEIKYVALIQALELLADFSLLDLKRDQDRASKLGLHPLVRDLLYPIMADRAPEATQTARAVYELALNIFRRWSEPHGFSGDFLNEYLPNRSKADHEKTVADYYKDALWARYIGGFIIRIHQIRQQAARIQEELDKNPGKRLGTIVIGYSGPDKNMFLMDLNAKSRPKEGQEVEILGYRFNLTEDDPADEGTSP